MHVFFGKYEPTVTIWDIVPRLTIYLDPTEISFGKKCFLHPFLMAQVLNKSDLNLTI